MGERVPMIPWPASYTHDADEHAGHLYYFRRADAAPGPYKKQRYVVALIDIADDGTLAGVELIDRMPPPPNTGKGDGV